MFRKRNILAVIPARGGSKGLPGKNIMQCGGKPLIEWSIAVARECLFFDEVIVSTDDSAIAEIAVAAGATVPFLRPADLASDEANIIDVLLDLFVKIERGSKHQDIVVLLQPTSPLRTTEDITGALKLYFEKSANAVVSVCEVDHHPYWMNELPPDVRMDGFLREEAIHTPRQQLPRYYRLNGALYIANIGWLKKSRSFFGENTFAYIMQREHSIDIDHKIDFQLAEFLLSERG